MEGVTATWVLDWAVPPSVSRVPSAFPVVSPSPSPRRSLQLLSEKALPRRYNRPAPTKSAGKDKTPSASLLRGAFHFSFGGMGLLAINSCPPVPWQVHLEHRWIVANRSMLRGSCGISYCCRRARYIQIGIHRPQFHQGVLEFIVRSTSFC